MAHFPLTIENGLGERLTFVRLTTVNGVERLELEGSADPGAGPPMHVHYLQDEVITVTHGRFGYQLAGEPPKVAGPGETVVIKAGVGHKWWNAGDSEVRSVGYIEPPLNVEFYLSTLFASVKASGAAKRPSLFDVAYLATRYRSEHELLAIPLVVQRALFPIVATIGGLFGKYRKFADAPAPFSGSAAAARQPTAAV